MFQLGDRDPVVKNLLRVQHLRKKKVDVSGKILTFAKHAALSW